MERVFCGGYCAEDLNEHLGDFLKDTPGLAVANADNVLGVLKSMKTEKEQVVRKGNGYDSNRHDTLNKLNISTLKHLGILKEGEYCISE